MIKDYFDLQGFVHYKKRRFLIPNLYRKKGEKGPHGSYRNRGRYGRYIKLRFKRKI